MQHPNFLLPFFGGIIQEEIESIDVGHSAIAGTWHIKFKSARRNIYSAKVPYYSFTSQHSDLPSIERMAPLRESDLIFSDQANLNFSKTLGDLKRSTLSIQNRLQSILADAAFAQDVASAYNRPLVANERCGSWYIDPHLKEGSAYFKSTDGHTSVWKFSSRRLNLHLLEIIGRRDGCVQDT